MIVSIQKKYAEQFIRNPMIFLRKYCRLLVNRYKSNKEEIFSASFLVQGLDVFPLCLLLEGKFSGNDVGNDDDGNDDEHKEGGVDLVIGNRTQNRQCFQQISYSVFHRVFYPDRPASSLPWPLLDHKVVMIMMRW